MKQSTETQQIEFTRVNNDVNGNPRYVVHFSNFLNEKDVEECRKEAKNLFGPFSIELQYKKAIKKSKALGGRKFHNKQYGGGIVLSFYGGKEEMSRRILEIAAQ